MKEGHCGRLKGFMLYCLSALALLLVLPVVLLAQLELIESVLLLPFHFFIVSGSITIALLAWGLARLRLPDTLLTRYLPLLMPVFLLYSWMVAELLVAPPEWFYDSPHFSGVRDPFIGTELLLFGTLSAPFFVFALLFAFFSRHRPVLKKKRGLTVLSFVFLIGILLPVCIFLVRAPRFLDARDLEPPSIGHGVDIGLYMPFANESNLLATLDFPPSLQIERNHPRLDGAIALLPLYGAVGQALYRNMQEEDVRKIIRCSNTPQAYRRLVRGEVDIFFGLAPSAEQVSEAHAEGVSLTPTPIGYDAFVFFVNKDNPVVNLTLDQVRAIYTRNITNWREVGGPDASILAFQRPANSGSQTTMVETVMRGRRMAKPLHEEIEDGMGDIVLGVAVYRNRLNAIGYSFRWYVTEQYPNPDIRLLSIDGIAPTPENIANKSYPLVVPLLAVTARPPSPESRQLIDWIVGAEGQALVRRTGYVPLSSSPEESPAAF